MAESTFMGMMGTGDFVTDQRTLDWRLGVLLRYPNGKAQLTGLTALMSNKKTTDYQYHYWLQKLPRQGGAVTAVYRNSALSSAYASGGTTGTVLYFKVPDATALHFRTGHQALMRCSTNSTLDTIGKVVDVVRNGASSYIAVKLLEADDNGTGVDLSDCDTILVCGNINPQGGEIPSALAYQPEKKYNFTQIFRTALEITNTAKVTNLRTGDQVKKAKREAAELHAIEMEKAFLWGIPTEGTGDNGKPETTTGGLARQILTENSALVSDYRLQTAAAYKGKGWLEAGKTWLDAYLKDLFTYGDEEKLVFCGAGALQGLNNLAEAFGQITLQVKAEAFGIQIREWVTPHGILKLKTHPLFTMEPTNTYKMLAIEPRQLGYRFMEGRDTKYLANRQDNGLDGEKSEYLTEAGLEYYFTDGSGLIDGVGCANTQS